MTTTDQLLPAIRAFADRYGLPDGLEIYGFDHAFGPWFGLGVHDWSPTSPRFAIWLAAALAHWETVAEDRLGLHVHESDIQPGDHRGDLWCLGPDGVTTDARSYTPGDLLSRLTARTLALLDGVRAAAAEGVSGE